MSVIQGAMTVAELNACLKLSEEQAKRAAGMSVSNFLAKYAIDAAMANERAPWNTKPGRMASRVYREVGSGNNFWKEIGNEILAEFTASRT